MNERASFARRNGDTEDLMAMRNAYRNGTPAERAEARAWATAREARMAEMQRETRVAPAVPATRPRLTEDEQRERDLAWALELAHKHFGGDA